MVTTRSSRSEVPVGGNGKNVVLIIQSKNTGEGRKKKSVASASPTPNLLGGKGGNRGDRPKKKTTAIEEDEVFPDDEFENNDDDKHDAEEAPPDEEESDDDESGYDSEGFEMPEEIERDPVLAKKFNKISQDIQSDLPDMTTILTEPMRKRHRKILFEWFHIYHNLQPCSQDRMEARKMIQRLHTDYCHEYNKYLQHKKQIRIFEKNDRVENSIIDMEYQIIELQTTDENKQTIYRKYRELRDKSEEEKDDEYYKMKQWLQWVLRMPFDRTKAFPALQEDPPALTAFIKKLRDELDKALFGMNDVKDQIMLFVHHKLVHPEMKGCSLGLIGEPGVGKTSIARCLARVMEFPFEQISFGGIRTTEHLKGFDYTYVGSQPGEIARSMSRMGFKNGILFLDEYEKVSENNDVNAFLLHLTDFSQNGTYRDNYLSDITMDLSCLWLIYSMNQLPEDKALRDRIFAIHVSGYSTKEKVNIIRDFLLPKHLAAQNLLPTDITIDEPTARFLVEFVGGHDKGIRRIEQFIKDLVFKITFLHHHGDSIRIGFQYSKPLTEYPIAITNNMIEKLCNKHVSRDTSVLTMYT